MTENKSELSDLGVGLILVGLAIFILIAPRYLDAPEGITIAAEIIAIAFAIFGVTGVLIGGSKSIRPPGVQEFGVAFLLGGIATTLAVYESTYDFSSPWSGITKWSVLLLGAIAAMGAAIGVSKIVSNITISRAEGGHGRPRSKRDIQQVLIAILGIATAIIGLMQALAE